MAVRYVIGVDQSLRNVAFCVRDNTGKILAADNVITKTGKTDDATIDYVAVEFFDRLMPYIELDDPREVVFYWEHILYGKQGKSAARQELAGVLKWNIRQNGNRIYGVVPTQVHEFVEKRFDYRYPRNPKTNRTNTKLLKEGSKYVCHRFCNHWHNNDDNIADAVLISLLGYAHMFEKQRFSLVALSRQI
jgi:hypothetical protein